MCPLLAVMLVWCWMAGALAGQAALPVIESLEELGALSDLRAGLSNPVRLRATVLYYDPDWRNLWLHSSGTVLYMDPGAAPLAVRFGQMIEIEGMTRAGQRTVDFGAARIRVVSESNLPPARVLNHEALDKKTHNNVRVQLEGRVRSVATTPRHLAFDLVVGGYPVKAVVLCGDDERMPGLEEARIRVRGVYGVVRDKSGYVASEIKVPSLRELEVLESGLEGLFTPPQQSVDFIARAPTNAAIRVRATVKQQDPARWVLAEDPTGWVRIETWQSRPVKPGDVIEAAGLPETRGSELFLRDAVFRSWTNGLETPASPGAASAPAPLRRVDLARQLSPQEAARGLPVIVRGVVTCFQPQTGVWYVQDSTGGIRIRPAGREPGLKPGDWVEVSGKTAPGASAPEIVNPSITAWSTARLPEAREASLDQLWTGAEDGQWVQVRGFVRLVRDAESEAVLELSAMGGDLKLRVPASAELGRLKGAMIRARGVCGLVVNSRRQIEGVQLWAPGAQFLEVEEPAPADPFAVPALSIAGLRQFNVLNASRRRVRVAGTVVLQMPGRLVCLQQEGEALLVFSEDRGVLRAGDRVEAAGFPGRQERRVVLRDAVLRKTGPGAEPEALELGRTRPPGDDLEARLVVLEGVLLQKTRAGGERQLTVQSGGAVFDALCLDEGASKGLEALEPGSRIRIKGVYHPETDEARQVRTFGLWLRSGEDVTVLERPSWWTTRRALSALALLSFLSAAGAGWVAALRRRVASQTEVIRRRLEREASLQTRYRELVENAHDMILTCDLATRFTSINQSAVRVMGYSPAEAFQMQVSDALPPEERGRLEAILRDCRQGSLSAPFELGVLTKAGRPLTLEVTMRLMMDRERPVGFQAIARDITERKQAEEQLRHSETRLAQAQRIGQVGSWEYDMSARSAVFSPECVRLMGFDAGAPRQSTESILQVIHPEDVERVRQAFRQGLAARALVSIEHRLLLKDGVERVVHMHAEVEATPEGRPLRIVGTLQDITAQKRAEEALSAERTLLRTLLDNLPDYVFLKDLQGRYLLSNRAHSAVLCRAPGETPVGRTVHDFLPAELARVYAGADQEVLSSGQTLLDREEPSIEIPGGQRWLSTTRVPFRDAQGRLAGVLGISHDITERRVLEMRLRQAQKMESVGQLAAGIAHDFNNIMTVVQGHTCLLLDEPALSPQMREALGEVAMSARRATDLTRQLLAFSRRQILQATVLDMNRVMQDTVRLLQRLVGEPITLELEKAPSLPTIRADAGMMEQIIMNLAVNARDAMPEGGTFRLATGAVQVDAAWAQRNAEARPGLFVRLSVTDTGCGMDAAVLQRIFEPFFTTKEVGRGTGLGLATVYGIVKQHEGWIEVVSQPGRGTTFHVFLPACAEAAEPAAEQPGRPAAALAAMPGGAETLLVVEDEPPLRQLVERVLKRAGYRTLCAGSGVEALQVWERHSASIDLLLTDMVLPQGITGRDLARRLQAAKPGLKVLYSTGYTSEQAGEGLQEGVNFIQKPYSPAKLIETVRRSLDAPASPPPAP